MGKPKDTAMRIRKTYHAKIQSLIFQNKKFRHLPFSKVLNDRRFIQRVFYNQRTLGAVGSVFLHLSLIFFAAWGSIQIFKYHPWLGLLSYFLCCFFIGTRFRALGNMLHEASHSTLTRNVWGNVLLGHFLAILDFNSFDIYRQEHFSHHRHTGDSKKDLDFRQRQALGFGGVGGPVEFKHIWSPITLFHFTTYFRPILFSKQEHWPLHVIRGLFYMGLVLLAHFVIGWFPFILYYVVPYLTAYQVLRYWSDAVDHAGTIHSPDEFHQSRNHILAGRFINWIFFPRNDQFHLVHHLFPSIPTALQEKVHQLLLQDQEYAARDHSLMGIFKPIHDEPAESWSVGEVEDVLIA